MTSNVSFTPTSPRMAFEQKGESGSNVLLVMGFGFPGAAWSEQVRGLAPHHQVCSFDNLGTGKSDPVSSRAATMDELASDAFRVMDALAWKQAHLVGVSMGGMIAEHMACRMPHRFHSLSLIATTAGGPFRPVPTSKGLGLFVRANTVKSVDERLKLLEQLLYTPEFLSHVPRADLAKRTNDTIGKRAPSRTLSAHLTAVLRHDARASLARLTIPALVVRPSRDLLVKPKRSDELLRLMPHAERLDVDSGHGCIFESAAEINRGLLAFFAKVDAAR